MEIENYSLASLRYDLSKLRAKGFIQKVPRTRRYQLTLHLRRLLEAVRAHLRATNHRPAAICRRRQQVKKAATHSTGLPLSACGRRSGQVVVAARSQGRRLTFSNNENKILATRRITAYAFSQTAPRKSGPCGAAQCGYRFPGGGRGFSWRPWRLGVRSFLESVDDTGDAVFDEGDVEVEEQPQTFVGQFQVGQELLFVHRCDALQSFALHDHCILYH